jgi:hypothetical protein
MAGTSAVTAASLQDAFAIKLRDIDAACTASEANFQSRMNDIKDTISKVKSQLTAIADAVTTQVLVGLQKENGLLWNQDRKIDALQEKLLESPPLVKQAITLSGNSPPRASSPIAPLRKNRRLETDSTMDTVLLD